MIQQRDWRVSLTDSEAPKRSGGRKHPAGRQTPARVKAAEIKDRILPRSRINRGLCAVQIAKLTASNTSICISSDARVATTGPWWWRRPARCLAMRRISPLGCRPPLFDGLFKIALAEAEFRAGDIGGALMILDEALVTSERTGQRTFEAELHRARGELPPRRHPSWRRCRGERRRPHGRRG